MVGRTQTFNRRLLDRRCVACGYDGALLRGGRAEWCARCGCDLRQRPARSYAEMEGLLGQPLTVMTFLPERPRRHARHTHKWLAFGMLAVVVVSAVSYLALLAFEI